MINCLICQYEGVSMKTLLTLSSLILTAFFSLASAGDLSLQFDTGIKEQDKKALVAVMEEVSLLLPKKMKELLPAGLTVRLARLSDHKSIPADICKPEAVEKNKSKPFIYGTYDPRSNTLSINTPVIAELKKGRENSFKINCQHKTLFDQALATIIHELTHAYDFHNEYVSHSMDYIRRAGFKKGLLKIKNKNIEAMRTADPYELVNIQESFAVNMEYFTMDPEFLCRKPSMFAFFKKHFEIDPYPHRNCAPNNIVLMSTQQGFLPVSLDLSRVYRVDYLLASAGKGIQSGFGHSMFRIVMCAPERIDIVTGKTIPATPFGKKCLDDKLFHVVVSYRANVEDATLNYMKGLTGGYPSMLFILSLGDVLDEYNRDELRDVVSYPLNLSSKEKEEFVTRVTEEHWNYRGAYKFINNNCAVESFDLLKSALQRPQLAQYSSLTPNGVLDDLDRLQFTSLTHGEKEIFTAKTEQLLIAFREAYGAKLKGSEKNQKDAVLKFIDQSSARSRMEKFIRLQNAAVIDGALNEQVRALKQQMVKASSFSVMEQQILRSLTLKFKKKAADMFMNTQDEKIKKLIEETGAVFAQSFKEMSQTGYGIPFSTEMVSAQVLEHKAGQAAQVMKKADALLKELMPIEYAALEGILENIKIYNNYSLKVRKDYRSKLESYVHQVLVNLTMEEGTRSLLISAAGGNKDSLKEIRNLLGADLVTEKEILDSKLRKTITEIVNG